MMISTVTGHFDDFDASVVAEDDHFKNAEIHFSGKTDSINTKNKDRDVHLKLDDFFNSAQFPEFKFVSKSYEGTKLLGDLTIRNITREFVLDVSFNGVAVDPYGQTKVGFDITGEINRKDFDLKWSAITEAGSIVVSDTVKLSNDVQLIKNT